MGGGISRRIVEFGHGGSVTNGVLAVVSVTFRLHGFYSSDPRSSVEEGIARQTNEGQTDDRVAIFWKERVARKAIFARSSASDGAFTFSQKNVDLQLHEYYRDEYGHG